MWARGRAVGGGAGTGMDFLLSQPMLSFFRSLRIGTKEGQSAHFISSSSHGHLPLYWQNTYTCKLPLIKYVAHSMKEMNNAVLYPLLFTCCGACLSHNTSMISTPKEHFCSKIVNINWKLVLDQYQLIYYFEVNLPHNASTRFAFYSRSSEKSYRKSIE